MQMIRVSTFEQRILLKWTLGQCSLFDFNNNFRHIHPNSK